MNRWLLVFAFVVLSAVEVDAGLPPTETQVLLLGSDSPAELRGRLWNYANRVATEDRYGAGEALYHLGLSYERAGLRDSAVLCYRKAMDSRGSDSERLGLIDALLLRRRSGDLDEAMALIGKGRTSAPEEAIQTAYQARYAWAQVHAGHPDSAVAAFAAVEERFSRLPQWRYRMALANLALNDARRAYQLLVPLAVASRRQDGEVMAMLDDAAGRLGVNKLIADEIRNAISDRDRAEEKVLRGMNGSRIRFSAPDGFSLGGVVARPAGRAPGRAAVVLVAPGDTIAVYDSLCTTLVRAGFAVLLMDVRGSGWSVAPSCPLPDAWTGREQKLQTLTARDVRAAVRALARETSVDTSRYLVVGCKETAPVAVEAAEIDSRIGALLILSPMPSPVDRGTMRARLTRLKRPTFFQIGPEDYSITELTDAFYQACNRSASRIADARAPGRGAEPLRYDRSAGVRFITWIDETLPNRISRRGTPPTPRRKG